MTLTFTSETPINSVGGCFVKYTFPSEFDLTNLDTQNVEASGMFVDDGNQAQ